MGMTAGDRSSPSLTPGGDGVVLLPGRWGVVLPWGVAHLDPDPPPTTAPLSPPGKPWLVRVTWLVPAVSEMEPTSRDRMLAAAPDNTPASDRPNGFVPDDGAERLELELSGKDN